MRPLSMTSPAVGERHDEVEVLLHEERRSSPASAFNRDVCRAMSCTIEGWMPSDGSSSSIIDRLADHRAGDGELLLLAARQRAGRLAPRSSSTGKVR